MIINQIKLRQLEKRTVNFSVAIVKTCANYSGDAALSHVSDRLIQSATSIGSHCIEANSSNSKSDFKISIYLAKREADQTRYWLKVLAELLPKDDLNRLSQEALKLTLVLQKIVTTLEKGE